MCVHNFNNMPKKSELSFEMIVGYLHDKDIPKRGKGEKWTE